MKVDNRDALYIWLTLNDFLRSNFVKGLAAKSQLLSLRSSATQVWEQKTRGKNKTTEKNRKEPEERKTTEKIVKTNKNKQREK